MTEINLDELFTTYTTDEQIKESFEKRTVPTGKYVFNASRAQARLASDASPWPGRKMASLFGALKDDTGKRRGSVGIDASFEFQRTPKGRADGPSMLWGQLVVALGMKGSSVGDVITAAGKYPLSVYVTESFKTPEGWVVARTPEDRSELRRKGYDPRNFVQSISKVA